MEIAWIKKYGFWVFPAVGISALLMLFSPDNPNANRITQADVEQVILGGYERAVWAGRADDYVNHMFTILIGTNQTAINQTVWTNNNDGVAQLAISSLTLYMGNMAYDRPYGTNETLTYTPYWGFPSTNGSLVLSKAGTAASTNLGTWVSPYGNPIATFNVTALMPWSQQQLKMGTNSTVKVVVVRTSDNTNTIKYAWFVGNYVYGGVNYAGIVQPWTWGLQDCYYSIDPKMYSYYIPQTLNTGTNLPYTFMEADATMTAWTNKIDYQTMTNCITGYKDDYGRLMEQLFWVIVGGYVGFSYIPPIFQSYAKSLDDPTCWSSQSNYAESVGIPTNSEGYNGGWRGIGYMPETITTQHMFYVSITNKYGFSWNDTWSQTSKALTNLNYNTNNQYFYFYTYSNYFTYLTGPSSSTYYNASTGMYSYRSGVTNYIRSLAPILNRSYYYTGSGYTNAYIQSFSMLDICPRWIYSSVPLNTPIDIITTNPASYYMHYYYSWASQSPRITRELMVDLYKYLRGLKYIPKAMSGNVSFYDTGWARNRGGGYNLWITNSSPSGEQWGHAVSSAEVAWAASTEGGQYWYRFEIGATYSKSWSGNPWSSVLGVGISRRKLNYLYKFSDTSYTPELTNTCDFKMITLARAWMYGDVYGIIPSNSTFDINDDFDNFEGTGLWFIASESPYYFSGGDGMGDWITTTNMIYITNNVVGNTDVGKMPNACGTPSGPLNSCTATKGYSAEVQGLIAPLFNYCNDETIFIGTNR